MKKILSLLVVVLSVFCVFGCSKKNSGEFVIGLSGPLTGGAALYGQAVANSAQLAVDELNEAGCFGGYTFKLVSVDDQNDASKISTNYAELVSKGMHVSLGTVTTKPCLEFKELAKTDNVFFMTPSATADAVPEYANAYQMCFSDNRQGTFAAKYVNDNVTLDKIGVLYLSTDDYSKGIYENFKAALDSKFELVEASFSESNPADLSSQVNLLKECKFIFLPIYYTPAATFMTQAKGYVADEAIYYGCDGLDGIDAIEGFDINSIPQEVSYLSHFNSKATSGAAKTFIDKYTTKYGTATLNQFGASAYDCVYAIYGALKQAYEANPDKVTPEATASELCEILKNVFQGGYTFTGVTGSNVTWDANGFVTKDAVKYIVKEADVK